MLAYDVVKSRLNKVFRDVFDDEAIAVRDEMTADDVEEWDSLSNITLMLAVEREFGIRFTTAEVGNLANVGEMMKLICGRAK